MMNASREPWLPQAVAPKPELSAPMQTLVARVMGEVREKPLKQLMLVGASGQVGTSTIARQAAAQLQSAFGSVLLIEIRPELHDDLPLLDSPVSLGEHPTVTSLSMGLGQATRLFSAWQSSTGGLPNPWLDAHGLVIWDVPPPTAEPLALSMARAMDGIVLVAQAGKTRRHVAEYVSQSLGQSGGRMLGVVLNRTRNHIPAWLYRLL